MGYKKPNSPPPPPGSPLLQMLVGLDCQEFYLFVLGHPLCKKEEWREESKEEERVRGEVGVSTARDVTVACIVTYVGTLLFHKGHQLPVKLALASSVNGYMDDGMQDTI